MAKVPNMLAAVLALYWKDLRVELRAKELIYSTMLFAVVVLLVFAFAFLGGDRPPVDVVVGVWWVCVTLAGTVAISRAYEREREGDTLRALVLSPVPRTAIYLGKVLSISTMMFVVELVAIVLGSMLFQVTVRHFGKLSLLLFLGTLGFAAVAGLFGASLGRARAREVLLPLLVYPIAVPVLIAGTRGTVALLMNAEPTVAAFWMKFLVVFDALFITLGLWVFEPLVAEES